MNDFKSVLLTLGDDAFFELVRNYLGPVKTPFNKHELIGRLEAFLRREDIQERIISLIDEDDAELLSAIWMLGEPGFDELHLMFARKRSYLDMHQQVLNLEDRLLIYRAGDRLRLNPLLLDSLERHILRPDRLFVSRPRGAGDPEPSPPWVTDTLLVSLYAWLQEGIEVFRADRSIRKRALSDLGDRLPVLVEATPAVRDGQSVRATVLIDALLAAGALVAEDGLRPVPDVWAELAKLTPNRRLATLAAAPACRSQGPMGALPEAIEIVLSTLPQEQALSSLSVERLLLVLAPDQTAESCRRAREMMSLLGMLIPADEEYVLVAPMHEEYDQPKPIVMQPNFDLMMPEELAFGDALFVARIARLTRHDRYPHFELTKGSLAAALREGDEYEEIAARLDALADGRLPQNVTVTMRSWAQEYESVRLFKGVILTVEESRRYAVEHSDEIQQLIRRELTPGVYLLDELHVEAVQSALKEAGVELVPELPAQSPPRLITIGASPGSASVNKTRLETLARALRNAAHAASEHSGKARNEKPPSAKRTVPAWRRDIESRLDKAGLSAEQREELAGRVRQKLILAADQIQAGALKTEKTEARGLDYVGKVRIIEGVIRTGGAVLEVIERLEDGAPRRRLVDPVEMTKDGTELVLVGEELPARTPVQVLVRKLGLVRRLRAGLVKRRPTRR